MTARTPMLDIQQAIYTTLTGDPTLMALISGVYDEPPEDASYPYVRIGEALESPDNRHGGFGRQTVVTLHTWTRYRGNAQGGEISDRLVQLLDHQSLAVDGQHTVEVAYEFGQALRDPEPGIRHHVTRFRVTTEQPA